MKIVINIKNGGYVTLFVENNKTRLYGTISQYKDILRVILNSQDRIEVNSKKNGTINFSDGEHDVIIENYLYNSNPFLKKLIEKSKKVFQEKKLEELRQRNIKRKAVFLSATVISLGAFISSLSINQNKIESLNVDSVVYLDPTNESANESYDYIMPGHKSEPLSEDSKVDIIEEKIFEDLETMESGSRVNTDKYKTAKANYYKYIEPIAKEYGLDPNLVLAIATQESGEHNVNRKGPAMGLMQIELSVWDNKDIYAYNHNNRKIEKVHITKEKLKDVSFNIRVGCMIFQNYLKQSNNNLEVAIQMYNYGPGNVKKAFRSYYNNPKLSLDEALSDYDSGWLTKRETIKAGDKQYLEHVLSYVEDLEDIMCFDSKDNEIRYNGYSKHL